MQTEDITVGTLTDFSLLKAYLPDGSFLHRSGRVWARVEALPLHSGIADACDYNKCL